MPASTRSANAEQMWKEIVRPALLLRQGKLSPKAYQHYLV